MFSVHRVVVSRQAKKTNGHHRIRNTFSLVCGRVCERERDLSNAKELLKTDVGACLLVSAGVHCLCERSFIYKKI